MQDLTTSWARSFERDNPFTHIRINREPKLSAEDFSLFMDGLANCVTFVSKLFPAERVIFGRKFGHSPLLVNVAGGSYATKGGTHAIAIYVNNGNPLSKLDPAQRDAIFSKTRRRGETQEISKWGQLSIGVNWDDRPIHVHGMLHQRGKGNPPGIVNYLHL